MKKKRSSRKEPSRPTMIGVTACIEGKHYIVLGSDVRRSDRGYSVLEVRLYDPEQPTCPEPIPSWSELSGSMAILAQQLKALMKAQPLPKPSRRK